MKQQLLSVPAVSLLCLNGTLPSRSFFAAHRHLTLVAADGAGCRLARIGFCPKLVVGDFDSFSGVRLPGCNYLHNSDPNSTDFDKCLLEMQRQQLFPALVVGMVGGSLDHSLYAVQRFTAHSAQHAMLLYDEQPAGQATWAVAIYGRKTLTLPVGSTVSLICFSPVTVSSSGLRWDLCDTPLAAGGMCTIRNQVEQQQVSVCATGGGLLLLLCLTT